jgi:hypothetical protein
VEEEHPKHHHREAVKHHQFRPCWFLHRSHFNLLSLGLSGRLAQRMAAALSDRQSHSCGAKNQFCFFRAIAWPASIRALYHAGRARGLEFYAKAFGAIGAEPETHHLLAI